MKPNLPLLIVNTGEIAVHDCMVWTEVEGPQVGGNSPETAEQIPCKTPQCLKYHLYQKNDNLFGKSTWKKAMIKQKGTACFCVV